ncbi:hypothetical protein GCM10023347_47150 [Streptomyces chumphonensis]
MPARQLMIAHSRTRQAQKVLGQRRQRCEAGAVDIVVAATAELRGGLPPRRARNPACVARCRHLTGTPG